MYEGMWQLLLWTFFGQGRAHEIGLRGYRKTVPLKLPLPAGQRGTKEGQGR